MMHGMILRLISYSCDTNQAFWLGNLELRQKISSNIVFWPTLGVLLSGTGRVLFIPFDYIIISQDHHMAFTATHLQGQQKGL